MSASGVATAGHEPGPANPAAFATWPQRVADRTGLAVGVAPSSKWLTAWGLTDDVAGAREFCDRLLDAITDVAAVKVQTPFFERFGGPGLDLLAAFLAGCAQRGTLTVADAKRCDTEDTMAAYAQLYLGPQSVLRADAVTVAPFLGFDAVAPLADLAEGQGCAVFVLVRTSNHEAGLQLAMEDRDRSVSEALADAVAQRNAAGAVPGPVAAVVGAPPEQAAALLRRMPATVVSLPGLGRPGRTIEQFEAVVAGAVDRVLLPITSGVLEAGPGGLAERIRRWKSDLTILYRSGGRR
jgi:orotidine-5'-phosphate decarboxylase